MCMRFVLCSAILFWAAIGAFHLAVGEDAKESGKAQPQKVGEDADYFLHEPIVHINFEDMPLGEAVMALFYNAQFKIAVSEKVGEKKVTFKFDQKDADRNTSAGEVLRKIVAAGGASFRVLDGVLNVATQEELDALQQKATPFKAWKKIPAAPAEKTAAKEINTPEDPLAQVEAVTDANGNRKFKFYGKLFTEKEFQLDCPDLYRQWKAKNLK